MGIPLTLWRHHVYGVVFWGNYNALLEVLWERGDILDSQ